MTDNDRLYLDVPFQEKEQAKQRGARWDPERRRWWVDPRRVPREHVAQWLPPVPPDIAAGGPRLRVRLMGLPVSCWRCGRVTTALVGFLPFASRTSDDLLICEEEVVLRLADTALPEAARQAHQVGKIKSRYSRTAGHAYLSNGCFHCDAILGNFPIYHEELVFAVQEDDLDGLVELAVTTMPQQVIGALLAQAMTFDGVIDSDSEGIVDLSAWHRAQVAQTGPSPEPTMSGPTPTAGPDRGHSVDGAGTITDITPASWHGGRFDLSECFALAWVFRRPVLRCW